MTSSPICFFFLFLFLGFPPISDSSRFPSRLSLSIFNCTRQKDEHEHYLTSSSLIGWAAHICRVRVCLCLDSITRGCCKCSRFPFHLFTFFHFIFWKTLRPWGFLFVYFLFFISLLDLLCRLRRLFCCCVTRRFLLLLHSNIISMVVSEDATNVCDWQLIVFSQTKKFSTSPSRKKKNLIVQSWFRISFFLLSLSSLKNKKRNLISQSSSRLFFFLLLLSIFRPIPPLLFGQWSCIHSHI